MNQKLFQMILVGFYFLLPMRTYGAAGYPLLCDSIFLQMNQKNHRQIIAEVLTRPKVFGFN